MTEAPKVPDSIVEPPIREVTEGEKIAHLIDLAGFIANKLKVTDGDPRIQAVLDVALAKVQEANVLADLLQIVHNQSNQPEQGYNEQRQVAREQWEADMRKMLLGNQERLDLKKRLETEAVNLVLQQLKNQISPQEKET